MILSAILAVAENGVIGRNNDLPWRLPDDLRRFKSLTMGHPILMGRKTFASIGRPLPGRTSIVITRQKSFAAPEVIVVHSMEAALARCADTDEAFVIGGAELFSRALPHCTRLYLTLVHAQVEGDVYFPLSHLDAFALVDSEPHPADDRHALAFTFRTYDRLSSS